MKLEYELRHREGQTEDRQSKLQARGEQSLSASNLIEYGENRAEAEIFLRWLGSTRTMIQVSSAPGIDVNSDSFRQGFICIFRRFEDQGYPMIPTWVPQ